MEATTRRRSSRKPVRDFVATQKAALQILNGHGPKLSADDDLGNSALKIARSIATGRRRPKWQSPSPSGCWIDVIDLFSGCGGLSLGLQLLSTVFPSYRLAGALDYDADSNATYAANLGIVPFLGDALDVSTDPQQWNAFAKGISRKESNLTLVIGGPPCQGFSSHRKTIDGCEEINGLSAAFAKMAVALNPDVIVFENVPEMVTDRGWPYFKAARSVLRDNGFHVRTRIYNLAGFGLPQERFRSLTIAMKGTFSMPEPFLERSRYRTVRKAIGHLPPIDPGIPCPNDPMHVTARHRETTIETMKAVPRDGGRRPLNVGPACLRSLAERNGRTGYDDVYGRLWWDRPAVTITGHSRNPASGRFVHPQEHRGLSVREASLLQGFPRDYMFKGSFDSQFLQVGNAVPPIFGAYVGAHILSELLRSGAASQDSGKDITAPIGTSFSRLIAGIKRGHIKL